MASQSSASLRTGTPRQQGGSNGLRGAARTVTSSSVLSSSLSSLPPWLSVSSEPDPEPESVCANNSGRARGLGK